jgi:predicted phage-related endonuclease
MIKCKNSCPLDKFDGCCFECNIKTNCKEACGLNPSDCENATIIEETALETFKNSAIIQKISDLMLTKKQLEEEEKQLKEKLKEAMEFYGVKKFESDHLTITYVAETITTTIDTNKLKKKYPDIAEECSRETKKSAYVRVSIK